MRLIFVPTNVFRETPQVSFELLVYKNEKPKNVKDNDEKIKSSSVNFI